MLESAALEAKHVSVQSKNVLNIQMDILWQGWLMLMLLLLMMLLLLLLFGIRKGEILLHIHQNDAHIRSSGYILEKMKSLSLPH